jgi:hypothetical protein
MREYLQKISADQGWRPPPPLFLFSDRPRPRRRWIRPPLRRRKDCDQHRWLCTRVSRDVTHQTAKVPSADHISPRMNRWQQHPSHSNHLKTSFVHETTAAGIATIMTIDAPARDASCNGIHHPAWRLQTARKALAHLLPVQFGPSRVDGLGEDEAWVP